MSRRRRLASSDYRELEAKVLRLLPPAARCPSHGLPMFLSEFGGQTYNWCRRCVSEGALDRARADHGQHATDRPQHDADCRCRHCDRRRRARASAQALVHDFSEGSGGATACPGDGWRVGEESGGQLCLVADGEEAATEVLPSRAGGRAPVATRAYPTDAG